MSCQQSSAACVAPQASAPVCMWTCVGVWVWLVHHASRISSTMPANPMCRQLSSTAGCRHRSAVIHSIMPCYTFTHLWRLSRCVLALARCVFIPYLLAGWSCSDRANPMISVSVPNQQSSVCPLVFGTTAHTGVWHYCTHIPLVLLACQGDALSYHHLPWWCPA